MAKKKRRSGGRKRTKRAGNPGRRSSRRSGFHKKHRRRSGNPSGGGKLSPGTAIVAVLLGAVGTAAVAGGLAFQDTISGNWVGAAVAGGGAALGVGAAMLGYPVAGVGIAAAGIGAGAAQFATYEVATYRANQPPPAAPGGAINAIQDRLPMGAWNGPGDTLPVHSDNEISQAVANLRGRIR